MKCDVKDTEKIRKMKEIIVPADKTRNLYAITKTSYDKLLRDNITKSYKQAPAQTYTDINNEAKDIAHSLELSDRMNCLARKEAFITLKDHKENFTNALPCRLINPAKSEMGRVSKAVLDRILQDVDQKLHLNMWRNIYDNALKASGFSEEAEYLEERKSAVRGKRRNRPRKITWFNPPFSQNVATNVGRKFRTLIRKHFPRSSKLYKTFNENTLKISYSCMPNMAAVIRQHNSAVMRGARTVQENPPSEKPCNCWDKDRCPLNGVCQIHSIVYKATVVAGEDQRDYIGLTAQTFKQRFYSHQQSFRDKKYQSSTALSKHIWSLKEKNTNFEIKWEVRKKAMEYQNTTGRCNLCVAEKLAIIRADKKTSLNKRSELVSKCRHENRYYLCNFPPPIS